MKIVLIVLASFAAAIALIWITGSLLPVNHIAARQAVFHQPSEAIWNAISAPPNQPSLTYESVEAYPPHRLVMRVHDADHNFGGTWTYEILPAPSGSLLRITERGEVYNPIYRFVSRFIMGHTRTIDESLDTLAKKFNETIQVETYGAGSSL